MAELVHRITCRLCASAGATYDRELLRDAVQEIERLHAELETARDINVLEEGIKLSSAKDWQDLAECRRLLRFVIDHGIRTEDGTKTFVWQHEWDEFLVGAENVKGDCVD